MLQANSNPVTLPLMDTMQRVGVIHLSNGGFTIVDPDRLEELTARRWSQWGGYVVSGQRVGKKTTPLALHRVVMRAVKDQSVDHRYRDKLDNRESSLRFATKSQNAANAKKRNGDIAASRYKGVHRSRKAWTARIAVDGKRLYLGRFQSEHEAARAYNTAAVTHFGEFARINALP